MLAAKTVVIDIYTYNLFPVSIWFPLRMWGCTLFCNKSCPYLVFCFKKSSSGQTLPKNKAGVAVLTSAAHFLPCCSSWPVGPVASLLVFQIGKICHFFRLALRIYRASLHGSAPLVDLILSGLRCMNNGCATMRWLTLVWNSWKYTKCDMMPITNWNEYYN